MITLLNVAMQHFVMIQCCQFYSMVGCALSRRVYSRFLVENARRLRDSLGFVKFRRATRLSPCRILRTARLRNQWLADDVI